MAEKKTEEPEVGKAAAKSGLLENKAVLLGAIVIVQALVAIGLTQFVIVPKLGVQNAESGQGAGVEAVTDVPEAGVIVGLQEIIVTLAGEPHRPRYLRINVNLEVKDQLLADGVAERLPQLRDIVIMTLSNRTAADLTAPEGKKGLRDEIFRKVNDKLPEGALMNVYFSDLVVQ